jgi:hypothetical protein
MLDHLWGMVASRDRLWQMQYHDETIKNLGFSLLWIDGSDRRRLSANGIKSQLSDGSKRWQGRKPARRSRLEHWQVRLSVILTSR